MSMVTIAIAIGIILLVLIIWQFFSDRNNKAELQKVANCTASVLFWGTVLAAVLATFMSL